MGPRAYQGPRGDPRGSPRRGSPPHHYRDHREHRERESRRRSKTPPGIAQTPDKSNETGQQTSGLEDIASSDTFKDDDEYHRWKKEEEGGGKGDKDKGGGGSNSETSRSPTPPRRTEPLSNSP